jgi:hypothetical protein
MHLFDVHNYPDYVSSGGGFGPVSGAKILTLPEGRGDLLFCGVREVLGCFRFLLFLFGGTQGFELAK